MTLHRPEPMQGRSEMTEEETLGATASRSLSVMASRWQVQTKRGGGDVPLEERGDCVPACITSILGLPLDEIPNAHGEGWWDRLQVALATFGYSLVLTDVAMEPPPGLWIASLPSLNLGTEPDGREALHTVVVRGYELVHDPSIGKTYDAATFTAAWNADKVEEGWVLAPRDPTAFALQTSHGHSRGAQDPQPMPAHQPDTSEGEE